MGRKEEFLPDGKRIKAEPKYIVAFWRKYTSRIPAQYAVATAQHESSFTLNEVDTEPNGFKSYGIFQISDEEKEHAKKIFEKQTQACLPELNLLKLDDACRVLALLAEEHLDGIITAAGLVEAALPPDVWFFVALSHNEGSGACFKTIQKYGLDADKWVMRNAGNPSLVQASKYFMDCVTGGPFWSDGFNGGPGVV